MAKAYSGKCWDDLVVGQEFWTGGRTVSECDVLAFSGVTGDFNPLHTDEEFARAASPFGTRVPHGPLIHDMYLGLVDRLGLFAGTALAFLEIRWKFLAPVLVGDTIHARIAIQAKRELKKADRGIVIFAVTLFNQREEPVQEGEHVLVLARRHR
jgi:acyl dehydratase